MITFAETTCWACPPCISFLWGCSQHKYVLLTRVQVLPTALLGVQSSMHALDMLALFCRSCNGYHPPRRGPAGDASQPLQGFNLNGAGNQLFDANGAPVPNLLGTKWCMHSSNLPTSRLSTSVFMSLIQAAVLLASVTGDRRHSILFGFTNTTCSAVRKQSYLLACDHQGIQLILPALVSHLRS